MLNGLLTNNGDSLLGGRKKALPQAQAFWKKIKDNASDLKILFVSDSTGSGVNGWPFMFTEWLASQCPKHNVSFRPYRQWSFDDSYGQQITTQTVFTTTLPASGWSIGESVTGSVSGAVGVFSGRTGKGVVFSSVVGEFELGETLTGGTSGNTTIVKEARGYQGWQGEMPIQDGTGENKIYVDSYTVSGGAPDGLDGWHSPLIKRISHIYDLIIYNHGHNVYPDNQEQLFHTHAHFVSLLKEWQPQANIILVRQNQRYDGTDATDQFGNSFPSSWGDVASNQLKTLSNSNALSEVAGMFGCGIIDVFSKWITLSEPKDFFNWEPGGAPGLHSNTAGKAFILRIVKDALSYDSTIDPATVAFQNGVVSKPNLAPNPLFNKWTNGVPDGWKSSGVISQDTLHFETGVQSVKLDVGAKLSLNMSGILPMIRGRYITIATRVWCDLKEPSSVVGGFILNTRGSGGSSQTDIAEGEQATQSTVSARSGNGSWGWRATTIYIPQKTTEFNMDMSTSSAYPFYIDRIVITPDKVSKDVSFDVMPVDYDLPVDPELFLSSTVTEDELGFASSRLVPELHAAFAEVDNEGNISLWNEVADDTTMVRRNDGINAGKRFGIWMPNLTDGISYTLTWDKATSNGCTMYHMHGSSTVISSNTGSLVIAYQEGDHIMGVCSPNSAQAVSTVNGVSIKPT